MQIDKHMTSNYTADDWIRLLKPIFDLMRRIPFTNKQGVPVELLAMFFGDKEAYDIQERLYVEKELHRTAMINEIILRRVIEGSVEPFEQQLSTETEPPSPEEKPAAPVPATQPEPEPPAESKKPASVLPQSLRKHRLRKHRLPQKNLLQRQRLTRRTRIRPGHFGSNFIRQRLHRKRLKLRTVHRPVPRNRINHQFPSGCSFRKNQTPCSRQTTCPAGSTTTSEPGCATVEVFSRNTPDQSKPAPCIQRTAICSSCTFSFSTGPSRRKAFCTCSFSTRPFNNDPGATRIQCAGALWHQ